MSLCLHLTGSIIFLDVEYRHGIEIKILIFVSYRIGVSDADFRLCVRIFIDPSLLNILYFCKYYFLFCYAVRI